MLGRNPSFIPNPSLNLNPNSYRQRWLFILNLTLNLSQTFAPNLRRGAVMKWAIGGSLDIKHHAIFTFDAARRGGGGVGVKHHKITFYNL